MSSCSSSSKNLDEIPHTPASHPLHPRYITGPVSATTTLTTIRRNLSRGTGVVFGIRFLFQSDVFLRKLANAAAQYQAHEKGLPLDEAEKLRLFLLDQASEKSSTMTCFIFENDATEKEELSEENYTLKLESLDGKTSYPLELKLDPALPERLKKERLPLTIRGEACTPNLLPYTEGFRVTYLRRDEAKETEEKNEKPPKPKVFEWLPWQEGVSQDLYRPTW